MFRRSSALALALACVLAAPLAYGQSAADRATARQLGQEGGRALADKDFKTAEDRFRRADALFHAPTLLLGLARAQVGLGRLVAAQESYNRIIREGVPADAPPAFRAAVDAAKSEVGAVATRMAYITLRVDGSDSPEVTIDGKAFPAAALGVRRPIDPGKHTVVAKAQGFIDATGSFEVNEAASAELALTLEKDPNAVAATTPGAGAKPGDSSSVPPSDTPPPGEPAKSSSGALKTVGWISLGVGAAGLAVGGITGALAMGKHSDIESACGGATCPPEQQGEIDSYKTLGTVSTIGFIAGGVGVAAGAVLLLTAPKVSVEKSAKVQPVIGPTGVGIVGRF